MSKIEVKESVSSIIKGAIFALFISLIGILIFAGIVVACKLNTSVIKAVNQFIKILALFLGVLYSVRGEKGFLKGGIIGVIFSLLIHLVFLIIGGEILIGKMFLDMGFCLVIGILAGALVVNVKRKN